MKDKSQTLIKLLIVFVMISLAIFSWLHKIKSYALVIAAIISAAITVIIFAWWLLDGYLAYRARKRREEAQEVRDKYKLD